MLAEEGYEPQYVGGMRVTDEHTLATARRVFLETNLKLVFLSPQRTNEYLVCVSVSVGLCVCLSIHRTIPNFLSHYTPPTH